MVCDFRALISPHIQICRSTVGIMSLRFNSDGTFRVLQMADIQDGPDVREDTIRLIEAAIRKAHPDLIVLTGDQIRGYDPAYIDTFLRRRGEQPGTHVRAVTEIEAKIRGIKRHPIAKTLTKSQPSDERWMIDGIGTDSPKLVKSAGRNGSASKLESWAEAINRVTAASLLDETRQKVRDTFAAFLGPALESRIPFAATYGNHDFQCGLSNAELDGIYREFPGCVNPPSETLPNQIAYTCGAGGAVQTLSGATGSGEPGTFALPVMDVDHTRNVLGLVILDSGDYVHGGGFGTPSPAALAFLNAVPDRIGAKSMVFQHMPMPEYYNVLKPVAANAMQGYRSHADTYYVLDELQTQPGGYLGEGISCPDTSDEFELLREGYFGVVAGHDHRNGFVGEHEGLLLIATPTCGFNTYGPAPAKRATRLIEFDIRHPYEPRTQLLEFGELVGKPSSKRAYTYAVNQTAPGEGEGDDLLRKRVLAKVGAWGAAYKLRLPQSEAWVRGQVFTAFEGGSKEQVEE